MNKRYTDEELINTLKQFYNETGNIPKYDDMKNAHPSSSTFEYRFGSFNNALEVAGFPTKYKKHDETEVCSICGTNNIKHKWSYDINRKIICDKCHHCDRNYLHGILNPKQNLGIAIITEHVVYTVLNDCEKCNTPDNFKASYDLMSKKYRTVNVKSALLRYSSGNKINWQFGKKPNSVIPNYYICIGFNEDRTEIQHVWFIPGNNQIVGKYAISIALRKLERASEYEVDPTPYNEVYQNLDIYSLPEFRNLPRNPSTTTVPSEQNTQEVY